MAWDVTEIDRTARDKKIMFETLEAVSKELASKLKRDNERFNEFIFLKACGINTEGIDFNNELKK